jgi:ATPase subunit of ABC transporter with duplicated ATPase domains
MALEKYPGTLIVVSHDREFLGGVAQRILEVMPDGKIEDFVGNYDDYLTYRGLDS